MKVNPLLWGECLSGALTQEELLTFLEEAGCYGLAILKKTFWKEVNGCRFYSITVRGFKYEKQGGCRFLGQTAVYLGPFKGVTDEEGHYFPRNVPVEICTDTFNKLSAGSLRKCFILHDHESSSSLREISGGRQGQDAAGPEDGESTSGCCVPGDGGNGCC